MEKEDNIKNTINLMKNTYILIMAGGIGSRFWPKSTESFPKQFIDIMGVGRSLLQLTVDRFTAEFPLENIFILTNSLYSSLVAQQLPQVPEYNILTEPSRNNTAPCIAYAGYKIIKKDPNAVIVVVPSDHIILNQELYLELVKKAIKFSQDRDAIVTLGIQPTRPDTGYGYIKFERESIEGVHKVKAFLEKPNKESAEAYVQSGQYLWNAGMFIWKASTLRSAVELHAPEIHKIFKGGDEYYNTDMEGEYINEFYPLCPNISIDYAVLEKANNVFTIPANIGWSDLGTWASLHEISPKDKSENSGTLQYVSLRESNNCIVNLPSGKKAIIRGLKNYIIVDEKDALLIYPKENEQEIKAEVSGLKK